MNTAKKPIPVLSESDKLRFFSKISTTPTEQGCLEWLANKAGGYGRIKIGKGLFSSHRIAYFIRYGEDPGELQVNHRCDNRACCNADHHYLGTQLDNMRDMVARSREARGEANSRAKLTAADIIAIRADPRLHRIIAADYGVLQAAIGKIKRRKLWNHV